MKNKAKSYLLVIILAVLVIGSLTVIVYYLNAWRLAESNRLLTRSQKESNLTNRSLLLQEATFLNPTEENNLQTGIVLAQAGSNKAEGYLSMVKSTKGYYELGKAYFDQKEFIKAKEAFTRSNNLSPTSEKWLYIGKIYLKTGEPSNSFTALQKAKLLDQESLEVNYLLNVVAVLLGNSYDTKAISDIYSPDTFTFSNRVYVYLTTQGYPQTAVKYLMEKAEQGKLNRDGYLLASEYEFQDGKIDKAYTYALEAKKLDEYYPQTYKQLIKVVEKLNMPKELVDYKEFLTKITW